MILDLMSHDSSITLVEISALSLVPSATCLKFKNWLGKYPKIWCLNRLYCRSFLIWTGQFPTLTILSRYLKQIFANSFGNLQKNLASS